ncbi:MAG: phage tail spike protein, partial [Romboutsia timonensis]
MVKTIFILNEQLRVIKVLTVGGQNTFFDDKYIADLSTGADSFEFSTNVSENIEEKYYVMFLYNEEYKLFQIIDIEMRHSAGDIITTCYCETSCLELLNSSIRGLGGEGGDMSAISLLTYVLDGTRWQVGNYSTALETNIQSVSIDKTTPRWTIIQDYMSIFNYEISPRVTYEGGNITGFYIDVYAEGELGKKTYKRFEYGRNIQGISKKKNLYDWCTAIIIDSDCDISNISIDSTTGYYKGEGSDTILAITENAQYNAGKDYIYGVYDGNEVDGQEAVDNALAELKTRAVPHFDYEVTTAITYEEYIELNIGDTVYVIDQVYNPPILLEARISKLELSFTDRNNCNCTLSNYKQLKSDIRNFNDLFDGTKKLTEADILSIRKYLADLDIDEAEIDKIVEALVNGLKDTVEIDEDPQPPKDDTTGDDDVIGEVANTEDFKKIILHNFDNGLLIGDKRIYDIKKHEVANVTLSTDEVASDSSKVAQQYKDALAYYKNFSLGTQKNNATLATIMSNGNKYKIPYLVRYWCGKFGIDTRLVYAMIMAESTGNPYNATGATGGYGLMQCERSCYFNKKQTIKFLDGTTRSFTPSYATMNPSNGITVTINGVKVNQNISNQIMFGCHELRQRAEDCHYNIFAALMGYNFGMAGMQWCVCEYIKDKYGYTVNSNKRGIVYQSTKVKNKYYEILDTHKAPF